MRARAFAVLVAVALGLVDLLALAHQAAEQHAVCGEHGELIHADGVTGATRARVDGDAAEGLPGPRPAEHDAAAHCRLCPGTTGHGSATLDAATTPGFPPVTIAGVTPRRIAPAGAVLVRAPKTSPPRA